MRFLRSSAIYVAANLASAAVPFLLLPLLTRVLSPSEYGSVILFALLVTLSQTVAGMNAHAAMGVVWFRRPQATVPAFTATALVLAIGSTAVVAVVAAAAAFLFDGFGQQVRPAWAVLAAITAGSNVVLQCRLVLWQSQQRALHSAALQFGASGLNVGLSLLAVLVLGWGADGRNAGIAAATVLAATCGAVLFWRQGELRWQPDAEQRRTLLAFGAPLIVHSFAGALVGTADRWSVSAQLDGAALGVYGAGAQLGMVMGMLADAFVKAFNPWLYGRLREGTPAARLVAVGAIYVAMPAFVLMALVVGAALSVAAVWLLGPKYQTAIVLLPWFVAGGAATGLYVCTSMLFFFEARTARLAACTLSAAVVGALATWWLTSRFGLHGAAAGFALTQLLLALFTAAMAMKLFDLPWGSPLSALASWRDAIRRADVAPSILKHPSTHP